MSCRAQLLSARRRFGRGDFTAWGSKFLGFQVRPPRGCTLRVLHPAICSLEVRVGRRRCGDARLAIILFNTSPYSLISERSRCSLGSSCKLNKKNLSAPEPIDTVQFEEHSCGHTVLLPAAQLCTGHSGPVHRPRWQLGLLDVLRVTWTGRTRRGGRIGNHVDWKNPPHGTEL